MTVKAVGELIRFDWATKKLLRSKANFGILEGFLSELLHEDLLIQEILESESNREFERDKFNRVDLLVKNAKGELIIIEVQNEMEADYLKRMIYDTAKVITEHLGKGDAYHRVVKVISVNIVYFDLGQGVDYLYHGTTAFIGVNQHDRLKLSSRQEALYRKTEPWELFPEYYIIKVNQFNDIAKTTLDEWIYFLKNESLPPRHTAKGLKAAEEVLAVMKLPETERIAYNKYLEDLHYQASMLVTNYEAARLEGEQKGKLEGRLEGKLEGLREGKLEGQREERLTSARKLLLKGYPIEKITELLDLEPELRGILADEACRDEN